MVTAAWQLLVFNKIQQYIDLYGTVTCQESLWGHLLLKQPANPYPNRADLKNYKN